MLHSSLVIAGASISMLYRGGGITQDMDAPCQCVVQYMLTSHQWCFCPCHFLLHPPVCQIALWSIAAMSAGASVATRPSVLTAIPAGDIQVSVRFNMNNPNELITNGKRRVYFWTHQVRLSCTSALPARVQQSQSRHRATNTLHFDNAPMGQNLSAGFKSTSNSETVKLLTSHNYTYLPTNLCSSRPLSASSTTAHRYGPRTSSRLLATL